VCVCVVCVCCVCVCCVCVCCVCVCVCVLSWTHYEMSTGLLGEHYMTYILLLVAALGLANGTS